MSVFILRRAFRLTYFLEILWNWVNELRKSDLYEESLQLMNTFVSSDDTIKAHWQNCISASFKNILFNKTVASCVWLWPYPYSLFCPILVTWDIKIITTITYLNKKMLKAHCTCLSGGFLGTVAVKWASPCVVVPAYGKVVRGYCTCSRSIMCLVGTCKGYCTCSKSIMCLVRTCKGNCACSKEYYVYSRSGYGVLCLQQGVGWGVLAVCVYISAGWRLAFRRAGCLFSY